MTLELVLVQCGSLYESIYEDQKMSRCFTLEEYLKEFVDEHTQSAGDDLTLLITERQAQTLGFFLINGLAGSIEQMRVEKARRKSEEGREDVDDCDFVN